jgi:hypothetical protein
MEAHEGDDSIVSVRAATMQRLYFLYLSGCHEDVVHSFSTKLVRNKNEAKSVEGQSNRDNLHGIWPATSPSSGEDRHSGRYRAKSALPTMLTSNYLPQSM